MRVDQIVGTNHQYLVIRFQSNDIDLDTIADVYRRCLIKGRCANGTSSTDQAAGRPTNVLASIYLRFVKLILRLDGYGTCGNLGSHLHVGLRL